MTLPNWLTLFRIILIPVFVITFYLPIDKAHLLAAGVFMIAALTDWLDGVLARILAQSSQLGAFLDPVADKLIVAIPLVLIVAERQMTFLAIPAAIIIGREIVVSALREWMAELGKRATVSVSMLGKIKTVCQFIAVLLLILHQSHSNLLFGLAGFVLIYVAAGLTIWSMVVYLKAAWTDLSANKTPTKIQE